ncbi:MAG: flavin reductase family protein [Ruminococcus sp.]|uniref:flavin reductase family protein n=1 Tax=Ruminococcus sp. TaxID=41978 RepID=UPI001B280E57|nr:flavin reductase family protein [Ruminococcus sp.]MBO7472941.1 flavin reductase family protein [Ruminococcus sp.]
MKRSFEKGFFAPLPVLIIGSYNANGIPNAMNVAWGGQVGMGQISISLSASHKTTANIRLNKEFTVAYATEEQITACDFVGIVSGNDEENKLEKCGFTVTKSDKINAPVIDQLPVTIECRVIDIQEEFGETRVIAEIVGLKADENVLTDGKVDYSKVGLVIYDTVAKCYRKVGESVAAARSAGKKFQ